MPYPELPRPDAPPSVALVRDFVNTTDRETGADDLATARDLADYLLAEGLVDARPRVSSAELALAHELRSALRTALEHHHDGTTPPEDRLRAVLSHLPVRLDWSAGGAVVEAAGGGTQAALARVGIAALTAHAEGLWPRLKVCSSDECAWAYFDHSKNRSRHWCEYGCGNRLKTRAYRERQRAARA